MARKRRDEIFDDDWGVVNRILNAFVGESGKKNPSKSPRRKKKTIKRYTPPGPGRRGYGRPRSDIERLKRHFGPDWRNHTVDELPPRGTGWGRKRRR